RHIGIRDGWRIPGRAAPAVLRRYRQGAISAACAARRSTDLEGHARTFVARYLEILDRCRGGRRGSNERRDDGGPRGRSQGIVTARARTTRRFVGTGTFAG